MMADGQWDETCAKHFKMGIPWNMGQDAYFSYREEAQEDFEANRRVDEKEALRIYREEIDRIEEKYQADVWP